MEFFDPASVSNLSTEFDQLAMTRGQARQIIDRFTREAVRKNVTPEAFQLGLHYLSEVGQSPDYTRSTIRNVLKSPMGQMVVENPKLAGQVFGQFGNLVEGVNPAIAGKHMGLFTQILEEAKKDNLLRPNVTYKEIEREVQKPMYGALQDWAKQNMNNPAVQGILMKTPLKANVEFHGKKGLVPIAAGFDARYFK